MRIVVVGGGGREHALQARFASEGHDVVVTPGRAGIPGSVPTPPKKLKADLFVIGPEVPLVDGLADDLREQGKLVFGPGADDAQLEGSKIFMKELLDRAGVLTAPWAAFYPQPGIENAIEQYFRSSTWDGWVIKTDYLAAGKGVLVTNNIDEAIADAKAKLKGGAIIIEQALDGEEVSFFAVCSGESWVLLPSARDYKSQLDGGKGPNTGGMGSFTLIGGGPSHDELASIIDPVLAELKDFRGTLFGGLMLTKNGTYVLEFNIRFGDPETQSILPTLRIDLGTLLFDAAAGQPLSKRMVPAEGVCVAVVLACEGYPTQQFLGSVIDGIKDAESIEDVTVLHAGTMKIEDGSYVVVGGRVLNVVGYGSTVGEARVKAYQGAHCISWPGMQFRSDIALQ